MSRGIAKLVTALALLVWSTLTHAADPLLKLPDFDALSDKAVDVVTITLDSSLLGLATRFLDPAKPEDAAARDVIRGLRGIYVRSFTFDTDFAYPEKDLEAVRKQLTAPGWQRLVETRSRKEQTHVDIYLSVEGNQATGLALIASEPREFTIVNIVGAIDLAKLHQIEGQFGIPKLELEQTPKAK